MDHSMIQIFPQKCWLCDKQLNPNDECYAHKERPLAFCKTCAEQKWVFPNPLVWKAQVTTGVEDP